MTLKPFTLTSSQSVQSAVDLFSTHKISTAPVIDTFGMPIGVVSEFSILKILIQAKALKKTEEPIVHYQNYFEKFSAVKEHDGISEVVLKSNQVSHHRVFVVDSVGHVTGVISPKDILDALNDRAEPSMTMAKELGVLKKQVHQIEPLKNTLKATEQKLHEFESLIEGSHFMLHSADKNGRILMANSRLHSVLGYAPGELVGKPIRELYPQHLWNIIEQSLKKIQTTGQQELTYSSFRRKNGEVIRVEVTSQAVLDEAGQFVATSTISRVIDSDKLLKLLNGVLD